MLLCAAAGAQGLHKYRGADGEWVYSDRAPADGTPVEIRELPLGMQQPDVRVSRVLSDGQVRILAQNEYFAPVEIVIALDRLQNVVAPDAQQSMRWVLPPRSETELLRLDASGDAAAPDVAYRYVWLPGDPAALHRPERAYRAPFAAARSFNITQAFPLSVTHSTPDSRYAVDIAMPVGTDIYAARAGTVVEVASSNFRGGADTSRPGAAANIVRVLHNDGTFAVYVHLNWNSIRVRPGDAVVRGQYIADSGNTGFSTGPHLHFVVMRNRGLRLESVPIEFAGRSNSRITPETGMQLTAY
ncbi:MAG: peptidoglycan DD-metalloendopeptidase family protein [Gammaproteobacteria bacterium]|nr:MAG: peptidoglycan DD-metalloendopeptidase family protein [Gammaproteobacteria bacterium]